MTVCSAIGIGVARRATPAAEPTPVGVTVGATLVDRTAGLAPEGETAERTAVEEQTATGQIEVVTETSLIRARWTPYPPRSEPRLTPRLIALMCRAVTGSRSH